MFKSSLGMGKYRKQVPLEVAKHKYQLEDEREIHLAADMRNIKRKLNKNKFSDILQKRLLKKC